MNIKHRHKYPQPYALYIKSQSTLDLGSFSHMISAYHQRKGGKIKGYINKSFKFCEINKELIGWLSWEYWIRVGSFQLPIKSIQLSSKFQSWTHGTGVKITDVACI